MFKSLKRILYFVEDIEKAKEWYSAVLGKQPLIDTPSAIIYNVGSCSLSLAVSEGRPDEQCEKMQVYWEVDDIDSAFEKLVNMGARVKAPVKQVLNIRIAQVIDPFGNVLGLTGGASNTGNRTVEKQPSETAHTAAFCRALAFKENREELKGPDYLAELFLNDDAEKILQKDESRKWAKEFLVTSPLYGYFIARTAFIDSVFKKACRDIIPQIVFLGAGYDTRSYRMINELKDTTVFELDINTTQQRKIEVLQKNRITVPGSLKFVPVNFKSGDILDSLIKAGYDVTKKTLFIWEGVTYYLTEEEVEKTISLVHKHSPEGSILCFDYMTDKLESINPAEPFRFWAAKGKIEELLFNNKLRIEEHIGPAEMAGRYLTLKDGTAGEKILASFRLVKAITTN